MKVITVNGQNHKGSTYHIGRMLAERLADAPQEIEEVFLPRDMPEFCCGCTKCFMENETKCPHYKYLQPITEKLDAADVMIFTSPVYVYHVTGSMKAFLDHFGYRWIVHRPEGAMFSKQAVCISTAAGGGMRSTCKDLKHSMFFWGVGNVYSYGEAVHAIAWEEVTEKMRGKIEKNVDRLAAKITARGDRVHPSVKTKAFFYIMRQVHKRGLNEADSVYWKEKGWTGSVRPWKG
ncbi:NAD(P)H-dependent oxidoreductase [Anaerovorax odorimutans]|uniref:NAD(P)H-dependent oxidoreductase n=1 Tax=Anaerovorax odorimutans TaxID=109327 RepID=A0ABT1RSK7_9FIRM|nr:NAD(P)H-dependent oxidoreductase [Anaerovorax odorimutans]MCQ4638175.1 NAD(P)H-dependent oxidoreductase [Anaerovorax odorimutans]